MKYNNGGRVFTGIAMPGDGGTYPIKIYAMDKKNNIAYLTFKLNIVDSYVPSLNVRGLNRGRQATVLKNCNGGQCNDQDLDTVQVYAPNHPPHN